MIENKREDILKHENAFYIHNRPDWVIGKIPAMSDYRKLSVDSEEEAMKLAKIGQQVASSIIPRIHGKPNRLYFTQALITGAAMLTRPMAQKWDLDYEKYRSVLMVTPSRYGKLISDDEDVITTTGWKKHGDLHYGDYVFSPEGKPIMILGESKPSFATYRIHFQNGQTIDCHANHEWKVWDRTKIKSHRENGKKIVDSCGGYRVLSTAEMIKRNYLHCGYNKYLVDACAPLEMPIQNQPLDPYFLGCWLGDGNKDKPTLCLSPSKQNDILPHISYKVIKIFPQQGCDVLSFTRQGVRELLKDIGVFDNKHIPFFYKYAAPVQQQALLAGIIDTDGYVDKTGRVIISCANETLANDILELLTLMGEHPYETVVPPITSSSGIVGKKAVHAIGFQPSYNLPTHHTKLTRIVRHRRIGITKIEPITPVQGKCIQVDSPDGLYLVGKKLIPTHNSFLNAQVVIGRAGANGDEVQIGGATRDKAAIIQGKVVEMLPYAIPKIQEGLIIDSDSEDDKLKKIKRLATQVSKESLKWTNGGSIGLFSTNESQKNAQVAAAGAIGIGGDFAVFDEVQIMSPIGFRTASRFMAESPDTKRFCVGNPMINGHFKELYDDPSTFVIHINDVTAIIEQRMTRRGFELTGMPVYSAEYRAFIETEFPDDRSGSRFFSTLPMVWDASKLPAPQRKYYFIGLDSAYQGGDAMLLTLMSMNQAEGKTWFAIEKQINLKERFPTWTDTTTLEICLDIMKMWEQYDVVAGAMDIGFGIHIFEKLRELAPSLPMEPINYSSKPTEWRVEDVYNAKYATNKRAELHLDFRDVCCENLMYIDNSCYEELTRQMQEVGQSPAKQKIQIEAKKDIKARLGRSPDNLDSACLAVHAMVLSGVLEQTAGEAGDDLMQVI